MTAAPSGLTPQEVEEYYYQLYLDDKRMRKLEDYDALGEDNRDWQEEPEPEEESE